MKRNRFWPLAMLLLLAALLCGLIGANLNTPVLARSAAVPADIDIRAYPLFGLSPDAEGSYELTLENPSGRDGLTLVLAAMRPFTLTVNGETRYAYTDGDPYTRLHAVPLPGGAETLHVHIHSSGTQLWFLKALLTTGERSAGYLNLAMVLGCVSVGIHLAMVFSCLTLFFQKRSEKYLLAQFAAAILSLISALLTAGVGALPIGDRLYVLIQYVVDSARVPIWTAVCLLLVPRAAAPLKKLRGRLLPVCLAAFAVLLLTDLLHVSWLLEAVSNTLSILGAVVLARGAVARVPWMRLLSVCYLFYYALNLYTTVTNKGLLPNTELLVYLYTPQLGSLVLLFACTLTVNHRFARKFSEAEDLVAELHEANATLDAKVAERTGALLEQQERRRSMMVNIFHDLRSPIFSARGCADMLNAATDGDRECLSVIRERLDFLSGLTEDLFLLAKLEDGKITFAQAEVPLQALCAQLAEGAALEAERGGVRFTLDAAEPLFTVGDGFRLKQALENLLQNALKFTPPGGCVFLSLTRDGNEALLRVRDTGKGIPAQDLPHVFERYYQGKNTDKQRSTGLGLSIAREIVRAHGGAIAVESEPGRGACFSIRLALAPAP